MTRLLVWAVFAATAAAHLAVPATMIARHEITLATGRLYKFRTAPVDPYDPFRGRYVALGFNETTAPATPGAPWTSGQSAYAVLEEDLAGFARIARLEPEPPDDGDYVKVRVLFESADGVHIDWPFDRYYMNEALAPAAETAYLEHSTRETQDAYATVRVRNGMAVIEGLFIGDEPIEDVARRAAAAPSP